MNLIIDNKKVLFLSFFLLTVSTSGLLIKIGISDYFAYLGYFAVAIKTFYTFLHNSSFRKESITYKNLFISLALTIGILVQSMNFPIKARLIITMLIIINFALLSRGVSRTFEDIRSGAHGIFLGIVFVGMLSLIAGFPFFGINNEGYFEAAYTGGFQHKNIFGFIVLSSYTGLLIYWKSFRRRKIDFFLLVIETLLLILSNARGALFLAIIFIIFMNIDYIVRLLRTKYNRSLLIVFILFLIVFYYFFSKIALNSGTFTHRLNGLLGWIKVFGNNANVMIFGNSGNVFQGGEYTAVVRNMINWVGTVEMGLLSILVKNGLIGLLGYSAIFYSAFVSMKKSTVLELKLPLLALIVSMILSILTEPYLVNTAVCYGTFSFLMMSRLSSMSDNLAIK